MRRNVEDIHCLDFLRNLPGRRSSSSETPCWASDPQTRLNAWGILRYFEIQRTSWDIVQVCSSCCASCSTVQDFPFLGAGHATHHSGCRKVLPGRWWGRGQFCPHGVRLSVLVLGLFNDFNVHYQRLLNLRFEIIEIKSYAKLSALRFFHRTWAVGVRWCSHWEDNVATCRSREILTASFQKYEFEETRVYISWAWRYMGLMCLAESYKIYRQVVKYAVGGLEMLHQYNGVTIPGTSPDSIHVCTSNPHWQLQHSSASALHRSPRIGAL